MSPILLVHAFCGVAAATAVGLYSGQVAVNSQSEAERNEALRSALGQVVIRLTGDPAVLARADVAKAVAGAEKFVQQYQYQNDAVNIAGQMQPHLTLIAQFDHEGVDKLLRDLGLIHPDAGTDNAPAVADMRPGTFRLWVAGVRSATDYARLIGALAANELVRDVQAEQVRGDGIQLRISVVGPLSRLLDALNSGDVVRVTNAKPPVDGIDALLGMAPG